MKKLIFGFAAVALSAPMALLAQEGPAPEPPAQGAHGQMACCQQDEDGKMQCPMMDHSQMQHGQMEHGQMQQGQMMDHSQMDHGQMAQGPMDGEQMAHGSSDGHSGMAHCAMMDGNADHPATSDDDQAQQQGAADNGQHQGHTPQ